MQKNQIPNELRKLLNLDPSADLVKIAQTARLHFSSMSVSISFRRTNRFVIAYFTDRRIIVPSLGSQQCPDLTYLIIEIVKGELSKKLPRYFQNLEQVININEVNALFLRDLLLSVMP